MSFFQPSNHARYSRIRDEEEEALDTMEAPETPHGPGTGIKGMAAGVLAMALGCAMLAFCFAFSSNVQWRRAKALQEDDAARHKLATSFFLKGAPEWAISSTLARTQSSYKATKSSAKAEEEQGSSGQVTIKVVSYPSEWFSGYHLLTEDGWFGYLLEKYSPDSVRWELIEYESVDYDLLLQDLADGVYEAGTVFVYKSNVTSADVIQQSPQYRRVSQGCQYCFSEGNRLIHDHLTRTLLASATPYSLIFNGDWCCTTSFPPSTHQLLRTDFGVNVMSNVDGVFPFGVETADETQFLAGLKDDSLLPPLSAREYLFSFIGMNTYRKPTRVDFNLTVSGVMDEFWDVANKYSTTHLGLDIAYDAEWCYVRQYHFEETYNMTYDEILGASKFSFVPAGDAYWGGRFFQALEYGSIPVMDDFDFFKGCESPTHYLKDNGPPVLLVKDWTEVPGMLDELLADPAALDARQAEIKTWWEMWKTVSVHRLVDFAVAARAGQVGTHECTTTPLTAAQEAAALSAYTAYYERDDWFSSFADSPFLCSFFCTTTIESQAESEETACFSPDCVPPPIANFTCAITAAANATNATTARR